MPGWIWVVIAIAAIVLVLAFVVVKGRDKRREQEREEAQELRRGADGQLGRVEEREMTAQEEAQRAEVDRVDAESSCAKPSHDRRVPTSERRGLGTRGSGRDSAEAEENLRRAEKIDPDATADGEGR